MSAVPTPYNRQLRFGSASSNNPGQPVTGADLDAELDAVEQSIDQTQSRLAEIQRDDGALRNGIVTLDSLSIDVTGNIGTSAQAAQDARDAALQAQAAALLSANNSADSADAAAELLATANDNNAEAVARIASLPLTALDFGAKVDGLTLDTAAIQAMASAMGFVRFPRGATRIGAATLDVPVYFEAGAYLLVDNAATCTFTHSITSPRQHIFRGAGSISLAHDGDSGEDARQAHVSWFGAFASSNFVADQAPIIQKALNAFGNTRESTLEFDQGNYHITTGPITVTRGCHVKGYGTRRTVFRLGADGFDVFQSGEVACKWSNIQFEVQAPLTQRATGAYISITHGECEVQDVQCYAADSGIVTTANNTRIDNIVGTFGSTGAAGSSLVWLKGGALARVSNIMAGTSQFGPDALVRVGGTGATGTVAGFTIENVSHAAPCASVSIEGVTGCNVLRGSVSGLVYNGSTGAAPAYALKITNTGNPTVSDINVSNVVVNSYATNGILLQNDSSGVMEDISFDAVNVTGSSGVGFQFTRTAGTMRDIRVGDSCNVTERATPFGYSGMTVNAAVKIAPMAVPNCGPAYCYTATVNDDSALVIDLQRSIFTGAGILTVAGVAYGIFLVRAAATPAVTAMAAPSANIETNTVVLTGTTGTDGKVTLSATAGFIYVENRLGSAQAVSFTLLSGL